MNKSYLIINQFERLNTIQFINKQFERLNTIQLINKQFERLNTILPVDPDTSFPGTSSFIQQIFRRTSVFPSPSS